jgi:predicted nicotinamide N-methyase
MSIVNNSLRTWPPETPSDAVGPVVQEKVILPGRAFLIERPGEPDRLLEHPAVIQAFERDEYMPYWADLWPAARMLAKAILRESWPHGLHALELGCGLGLPGIAALAKGLRVTFSDYDATALHFAARNARLNNFHDFQVLRLDWRQPTDATYQVLLASDLLYEERNVVPVVRVLEKTLAPEGICLLTDQDRKPAPLLQRTLSERGLSFTTRLMRAGQPGSPRVKGTLYHIRRAN